MFEREKEVKKEGEKERGRKREKDRQREEIGRASCRERVSSPV